MIDLLDGERLLIVNPKWPWQHFLGVDKHLTERIAIDSHIEFHNLLNDNRVSLPYIGVMSGREMGGIAHTRIAHTRIAHTM